jgi:PAS domain S-box-containing protein
MRDLAPDHEQHWFDIYGKIALTGEPAQFINEAKALNRWFEVNAFRVGGEESRKVAICFYDITRRKIAEIALQESESRFKAIAEATPVGIGVVGLPEATFLYVNPAYLKGFGYKESEILGQGTPQIYWNNDERDQALAILKAKGSVAEYEVKLKRKDGTPFWGLSSVRPITYDGKPALLGAFVDITDRKIAEEKIVRTSEELRQTNEDLARFNRAMVGRELRMIEMKKEINDLCHRLGEPTRYDIASVKEL